MARAPWSHTLFLGEIRGAGTAYTLGGPFPGTILDVRQISVSKQDFGADDWFNIFYDPGCNFMIAGISPIDVLTFNGPGVWNFQGRWVFDLEDEFGAATNSSSSVFKVGMWGYVLTPA